MARLGAACVVVLTNVHCTRLGRLCALCSMLRAPLLRGLARTSSRQDSAGSIAVSRSLAHLHCKLQAKRNPLKVRYTQPF